MPGRGAEDWRGHFARRHRQAATQGLAGSLDYSNDPVRIQTYAYLLEGAGPLAGRRFLDAGCGWGSLALALHGCGARVTAFDFVSATIERLRERYPFIDWRVADLSDAASLAALPSFDGVVAAEVLQYVDFETAVATLWRHVGPGGRLVAAIPNAACPIARRAFETHGGRWRPVEEKRVRALAAALAAVAALRLLGLSFRRDQGFLPYRASGWGPRLAGRPNRILFVLEREGAGESAHGATQRAKRTGSSSP